MCPEKNPDNTEDQERHYHETLEFQYSSYCFYLTEGAGGGPLLHLWCPRAVPPPFEKPWPGWKKGNQKKPPSSHTNRGVHAKRKEKLTKLGPGRRRKGGCTSDAAHTGRLASSCSTAAALWNPERRTKCKRLNKQNHRENHFRCLMKIHSTYIYLRHDSFDQCDFRTCLDGKHRSSRGTSKNWAGWIRFL